MSHFEAGYMWYFLRPKNFHGKNVTFWSWVCMVLSWAKCRWRSVSALATGKVSDGRSHTESQSPTQRVQRRNYSLHTTQLQIRITNTDTNERVAPCERYMMQTCYFWEAIHSVNFTLSEVLLLHSAQIGKSDHESTTEKKITYRWTK